MSILIKGMDMPKKCDECHFYRYWDEMASSCRAFNKTKWIDDCDMKKERHPDCPLVEMPTPHGRLIDADALLERFEKEEKAADEHGRDFSFSFKSGGENCTEWWPVQQMLMDAPTIIPAEPPKESES